MITRIPAALAASQLTFTPQPSLPVLAGTGCNLHIAMPPIIRCALCLSLRASRRNEWLFAGGQNRGSVQHNLYWPSNGGNKKLGHNLGTWPQGEKRSFKFDHPGVISLLCNVHPEMSGYFVVGPPALRRDRQQRKLQDRQRSRVSRFGHSVAEMDGAPQQDVETTLMECLS